MARNDISHTAKQIDDLQVRFDQQLKAGDLVSNHQLSHGVNSTAIRQMQNLPHDLTGASQVSAEQ